jgi:predicted pyridoxine 5'-phosphate oxidase superfamily flavin-nucleotide-binding protein
MAGFGNEFSFLTRVLGGNVGPIRQTLESRAFSGRTTNQIGGSTTMIPEKLLEIMKQDGVVAIATLGKDGPHMVNTWNSYLRISSDGRLFIPAGYMHKTEANIAHNPNVLITLGSSKVMGLHGPGAGFLIKGKASFITSGPDFDFMKEKFSWLRATLAVVIDSATQTW